jgi:hypothetical protein
MICPCCYRTLTLEAELPPPRGIGRLGDLYCVNCRWLFAVEMLGERYRWRSMGYEVPIASW